MLDAFVGMLVVYGMVLAASQLVGLFGQNKLPQ